MSYRKRKAALTIGIAVPAGTKTPKGTGVEKRMERKIKARTRKADLETKTEKRRGAKTETETRTEKGTKRGVRTDRRTKTEAETGQRMGQRTTTKRMEKGGAGMKKRKDQETKIRTGKNKR